MQQRATRNHAAAAMQGGPETRLPRSIPRIFKFPGRFVQFGAILSERHLYLDI